MQVTAAAQRERALMLNSTACLLHSLILTLLQRDPPPTVTMVWVTNLRLKDYLNHGH